jgi:hypothetical protein
MRNNATEINSVLMQIEAAAVRADACPRPVGDPNIASWRRVCLFVACIARFAGRVKDDFQQMADMPHLGC